MSKYTTYLNSLNIDTKNSTYAVEDANAVRYEDEVYVDHVKQLTDSIVDATIARHTFLYIVEQIVTQGKPNLNKAIEKAKSFITKNPWSIIKPEYTNNYVRKSEVDALGKPKQKKGAKKAKAIQVFKDKINGLGLKRKDAIAILVEEVGLTSAGASTYYHNLQTGTYQ